MRCAAGDRHDPGCKVWLSMDLWTYERRCWEEGKTAVCGVDEAGAGPLAGPVYAAAVILPRELEIPGLNDSKKLTEKKREVLFDIIVEQAVAYSIARIEASEIDEIDILNARMKAMQMAIDGLSVIFISKVIPELCRMTCKFITSELTIYRRSYREVCYHE